MIDPIRIHLTLGVMALQERSEKTVASALALLESLKPRLEDLIQGTIVQVPLQRMGVFERGPKGKREAGVLWVAPKEERLDSDVQRLHAITRTSVQPSSRATAYLVLGLVHSTFKRAGYITDTRDPELHMTIMNTTFKRPRPKVFQGFSFSSIVCCSEAMRVFHHVPAEAVNFEGREASVNVELGTWSIPEIQLCIMGSKGPRGEYISCGSVKL